MKPTNLNVKTICSVVLLATVSPVLAQPTNATNPAATNAIRGRGTVFTNATSGRVIPSRPLSGTATNPAATIPSFPAPPAARTSTVPPPAARAETVSPPAAGVPTPAKTNPDDEIVPLLNVDNMPLGQFLDQVYVPLVNRTILRSSQLPVTTLITLKASGPLTKKEAITAVETVLAMNGFTIIPVGEKFIKVVPAAEAGTQGSAFNKLPADDLPVSGRFVTQIIQLKNVPAQDAAQAISPFASGRTGVSIVPIASTQTLVLRDFSENIKRMLEVIEEIDKVSELNVKPEIIPIKYAMASDIAQVLGSLTTSGPGLSVGRSSRTGLSSGGMGNTTGGMNTGFNTGNTTTPNTGTMNTGTSGTRSSFANRLNSIVNRMSSGGDFQILGETKIIADERTNSLLIFANDQDMVMIKTIISQLDVVLAQVLIEAIIMEVSLSDSQNFGVSYLQQPKSLGGNVTGAGGVINPSGQQAFLNPVISNLIGGGTNSGVLQPSALPGGFSYFGKVGNSFDVAVTAAANDSRINVLSRPSVQTSHAVEAQLFIGDTVPYVTGTYFGGINGQASSQYQQKEVGITLNVLPLINPDGLVVMDISQNIEQLGTPITIDNNPVPTTTKRQATAKVAVRDRETVVLGGFISSSKTKSNSGVPYLKDIPFLGNLFRSKNDSSKRVELMVFMRPTVLPTPEAAAVAASEQRDRLPGVKQAEFEIREEERKRNEAAEAEIRKKLGLKEPAKR